MTTAPKQAGKTSTGARKASAKSARSRAREFVLQALYQYLVSRYGGAVAIAADATDTTVAARLEALRGRLADGRDHSIAELFLQRADALIEGNDAAATRSAAAIADVVVPTYLRIVDRRSPYSLLLA